jgi:hypothetical protein
MEIKLKYWDFSKYKYSNLSFLILLFSKNWKKLSCLTTIGFDKVSGLLVGDKTGEIKFININSIKNLPIFFDEVAEKKKPQTDHEADHNDENVKVLPFGHQ